MNKNWKNIEGIMFTIKNSIPEVYLEFEDNTGMGINYLLWKDIVKSKAPKRNGNIESIMKLTDESLSKAKTFILRNPELKNIEEKSEWIKIPENKDWTIFDMAVGQLSILANKYCAEIFCRIENLKK